MSGRAGLLALSIALSGCVLLDAREALTIQPAGTLYASSRVRLRVNGPCDTFTLEVDGKELAGAFQANRDLSVPVDLPDGRHRLVARAREGALPASAARDLIIDRTPFQVAWVTPAPGAVTTGEPLVLTAGFTNRLEPVEPVATVKTAAGVLTAAVTVAEDRRSARIALDSLDVLGTAEVTLAVGSPLDMGTTLLRLGTWWAPTFSVTVAAPSDLTATRGPLRFTATAEGDVPATSELVLGGRVIAQLGPPPWSLDVDTTSAPEGVQQLEVQARGHHVRGELPRVIVDRTAPQVTRCGPAASAPDQAGVAECVRLEFSEPVFGAEAPRLLVAGTPRLSSASSDGARRGWLLCPSDVLPLSALPAAQSVSLSGAADLAGNPLVPFECSMTVPAWRSPWGVGPLGGGAGLVSAAAATFGVGPCGPGAEAWPLLTLTDGGAVESWASVPYEPWRLVKVLAPVPGAAASSLRSAVWIERTGAGPGSVHHCLTGPPLGGSALDARNPAGGDWQAARPIVAWSQEDPAGGRSLRVLRGSTSGGTFGWSEDLGGPPRLAPGSIADEPAIASAQPNVATFVGALLSWTEAAPDGVARVRAATIPSFGSTWTVLPEVENADPSASASSPEAWAYGGTLGIVTWVEGGHVLARLAVDGRFGGASVLDVDPARGARMPRAHRGGSSPDVYWVERAATGDEIWGRRWSGAAWELLPGPVNAGAEGITVRSLDVGAGAVTWTDELGRVRLRMPNF